MPTTNALRGRGSRSGPPPTASTVATCWAWSPCRTRRRVPTPGCARRARRPGSCGAVVGRVCPAVRRVSPAGVVPGPTKRPPRVREVCALGGRAGRAENQAEQGHGGIRPHLRDRREASFLRSRPTITPSDSVERRDEQLRTHDIQSPCGLWGHFQSATGNRLQPPVGEPEAEGHHEADCYDDQPARSLAHVVLEQDHDHKREHDRGGQGDRPPEASNRGVDELVECGIGQDLGP